MPMLRPQPTPESARMHPAKHSPACVRTLRCAPRRGAWAARHVIMHAVVAMAAPWPGAVAKMCSFSAASVTGCWLSPSLRM